MRRGLLTTSTPELYHSSIAKAAECWLAVEKARSQEHQIISEVDFPASGSDQDMVRLLLDRSSVAGVEWRGEKKRGEGSCRSAGSEPAGRTAEKGRTPGRIFTPEGAQGNLSNLPLDPTMVLLQSCESCAPMTLFTPEDGE